MIFECRVSNGRSGRWRLRPPEALPAAASLPGMAIRATALGICGRRQQRGHRGVIKPWPLRPSVEGGFTPDDFTVNAAAATVTCPAGITRPITARNAVIFGAACRDCAL